VFGICRSVYVDVDVDVDVDTVYERRPKASMLSIRSKWAYQNYNGLI